MYKHVLVTLENSGTDSAVLAHIRPLLEMTRAKVTLAHVADGYAARNQAQLDLQDSEEMNDDRAYLDRVREELAGEGFDATAELLQGDPADQIIRLAERIGCDLIAMATHGHRFFGDLVLGSVASKVRHLSLVPVLLVPARKHKPK